MLTENKRNKAKHKLRLLQKVCLNYVTNSFEHNPDAKHYLFHLPRQKSDPSNKRKVVKTLSIVRSFSTNIFRQPPSPTNRRHRRWRAAASDRYRVKGWLENHTCTLAILCKRGRKKWWKWKWKSFSLHHQDGGGCTIRWRGKHELIVTESILLFGVWADWPRSEVGGGMWGGVKVHSLVGCRSLKWTENSVNQHGK